MAETQKCNYPTLEGAQCQNEVSLNLDHCAAGHPVKQDYARAALGEPIDQHGAAGAPTFDAEDVLSDGLPGATSLRHEAVVDVDIAEKYGKHLAAQRELFKQREYSVSNLHALIHNNRYRSGKELAAERESILRGDLDLSWKNAQKNPPRVDALVAHLSSVLENDFVHEDDKRDVTKILGKVTTARAALEEARGAYLDAEEKYAGWSRFFLVTNTGGHIHSSMSCSTCRPTTDFGWLPELSGLDQKAAVDAEGARLCSVCFPDAPVEWQEGYYAEEAAKKAASKCKGSGTSDYSGTQGKRYQKCNACGEVVSITSRGLMRAHKPKKS